MRTYLDTRHYNMPYKNMSIQGYGADPAAAPAIVLAQGADGYPHWSAADAAAFTSGVLATSTVTQVGGPDAVTLNQLSPTDAAAAAADPNLKLLLGDAWVKARLKENKIVIIPVGGGTLLAIKNGDDIALKAVFSTQPGAGIFAIPSFVDKWFHGSMLYAGAAAVGAGVLGFYLYKKFGKKKSTLTSNKRRHHKRSRRHGRR